MLNFGNFTAKQIAMFGAMVGDAMGVPHEFKSAHAINMTYIVHPTTIDNDYKTYNVPLGVYSDDFSQQLCVERHFCRDKIDVEAFHDDLLNWECGKYWVNERKFDEGIQTASQLSYYARKKMVKLNEPDQSGNGSLMRVLPVAFCPGSDDSVNTNAFLCSAITHNTEECVQSCQFYALLARILSTTSMTFNECWKEAEKKVGFNPYCLDYNPGSGYVIDSMNVLYEVMNNAINFEDAIGQAIMIGGDTDTNACIVGGIAALVFGIDMPKEWLDFVKPSLENEYVKELFGV